MPKTVVLVITLDTKGAEAWYLEDTETSSSILSELGAGPWKIACRRG